MDVIELKKIANEVRKGIVTSVHSAKAGHPGGSLSAADVFTYLYFEEMNMILQILRKQTETVSFCLRVILHLDFILYWLREVISL